MLTGVTLTGADDSTDVYAMWNLSQQFPFVEWGILHGSSSKARFPSRAWLANLVEAYHLAHTMNVHVNLAVHLCGKPLTNLLQEGKLSLPVHVPFNRIQLNIIGRVLEEKDCDSIITASKEHGFSEIIIQLGGKNDWVLDKLLENDIKANGLYDISGGKGIKPSEWPLLNPKWSVGYAGGLGPENIKEDLAAIKTAAGDRPFWIDMETKLRNDSDEFDLGKCRQILKSLASEFGGR